MKVKDMIARAHDLIINAAIQRAWEGSAFEQEPEEVYADILIELGALEDVRVKCSPFEPNIFITADEATIQAFTTNLEALIGSPGQAIFKMHGEL